MAAAEPTLPGVWPRAAVRGWSHAAPAAAWERRVEDCRRLLAAGEGAAAIAELVVRPGLRLVGRRYRPGGVNELAGYLTAGELRTTAATAPVTVIPSYAYTVVDVDYSVASDLDGCEAMAADVHEFLELMWDSGIDVVRVRSGGHCDRWASPPVEPASDAPAVVQRRGELIASEVTEDGRGRQVRRYHHEHLWIVTGVHTIPEPTRRWLGERLRSVLPHCQLVGGARLGGLDGQQVRPPGSRHRTSGPPAGFEYAEVLERLALIDPPRRCFEEFATRLEQAHQRVVAATRQVTAHRRRDHESTALADWADTYLEHGIPDIVDRREAYPDGGPQPLDRSRSAQFARLVGHLLHKRWREQTIVDRLAASPASDHLVERLGRTSRHDRVAADVARLVDKHRTRQRPVAPDVVHDVAGAWAAITWPDGTVTRGLTQSGRAVMAALCRHAIRTGYLRVQAQQRTLAIEAGVSLAATNRALHAWIESGAVRGTYDDHGRLAELELQPDVLARLLPDGLTGTQKVHAPREGVDAAAVMELADLVHRHDAWVSRPAGSSNVSVRLGRAAQSLLAQLMVLGGSASTDELARVAGLTRGHVLEVLRRLRYHLIVRRDGIHWSAEQDVHTLRLLLDAAATAQNTAGLLEQRRQRYRNEIELWQAARLGDSDTPPDHDDVRRQLRLILTEQQPRAPTRLSHAG